MADPNLEFLRTIKVIFSSHMIHFYLFIHLHSKYNLLAYTDLDLDSTYIQIDALGHTLTPVMF